MSDPFAAPEGLSNVPQGLWPSPSVQICECDHTVAQGELIGRYGFVLMCEDCINFWWGDSHGGLY